MGQVTTEQYLENVQNNLLNLMTKKKDQLPAGFNQMRFALNCTTVIGEMLRDKRKRETLSKLNIDTIVLCLMKGAYLGLDFLNGECYAIPYGNTMNFQTDYKGEIKVCKRFGKGIKDIYAKIVREGDYYDEGVMDGRQKIEFKPIPFSNKPIIGAFAVVLYEDGSLKYDSMSTEEIEHTRKTYSKASDSQAWRDSTGEMYKKTVIRRLSKLIDKNLDNIEQIRAYEDGAGMSFDSQNEVQEQSVVNVFDAPKQQNVLEEPKEMPQMPIQQPQSAKLKETVPVTEPNEFAEFEAQYDGFMIPDEQEEGLPFK